MNIGNYIFIIVLGGLLLLDYALHKDLAIWVYILAGVVAVLIMLGIDSHFKMLDKHIEKM